MGVLFGDGYWRRNYCCHELWSIDYIVIYLWFVPRDDLFRATVTIKTICFASVYDYRYSERVLVKLWSLSRDQSGAALAACLVAVLFITIFVTVFATAIAVTKDLADIDGDKQFGIETFTTKMGVKNVSYIGSGLLLMNYVFAIGLSSSTRHGSNRRL